MTTEVTPGDLGEGVGAWERFVNATLESPNPDVTPYQLAAMALLCCPYLGIREQQAVPGVPGGRPNRATLRRIGTELLTWAQSTPTEHSPVWNILGLVQRTRHPLSGGAGEDEMPARLADLHAATEVAATLDPDLHAWMLLWSAVDLRTAQQDQAALRSALQAIDVLEAAGAPLPGRLAILAAATGGAPGLPEHEVLRPVLMAWACGRTAVALRMMRDYAGAVRYRDRQIVVAHSVRFSSPTMYGGALGARAGLARATGDITTALAVLDRSAEWAAEASTSLAARIDLRHAYDMAVFIDDLERAMTLRLDRLRLRLEQELGTAPALQPAAVGAVLDGLYDLGRRQALTAIGNDAYELARTIMSAGLADDDQMARDEARGWLDVAESAWREISVNGRVAIAFRRAELDFLDGRLTPLEVGREMVRCSKGWRRAAGKRRAAIRAVRYCEPGDQQVLDWLEEMRLDAPGVDRAYLEVGIAQWHLRAAQRLQGTDRSEALERAARLGQAAAQGLLLQPPEGGVPVNVNREEYICALQVRVDALGQLRHAGADTLAQELEARVATLPAVAQRVMVSGSRQRRAYVDRQYHQWLVDTLELAVQQAHGPAVDQVAEVMRRDVVGTILYGLTQDDMAPERIAELARKLTAALNASVQESEDGGAQGEGAKEDVGSDDATQDPNGQESQNRAVTIAGQLEETLDVMGTVLGPVAQNLFDPRTVGTHTVTGTLSAAYGQARAAVLSLIVVGGQSPTVVRHLAWRAHHGGPVSEHLDRVPVPPWLVDLEVGDAPDRFFARLSSLGEVLLPPALADLLAASDAADPLPLTVVPTGLLGVPFAALASGGRLLLETAVVSAAQSLQVVQTLAGLRGDPGDDRPARDLAVYDVKALVHARHELAALRTHRPGAREARTLAEIGEALADPDLRGALGILALAVHGTRGADGWTQAKRMPSGEWLTTGHVLQWYLPRLVVGASCNTDIRADSGGELGGFPLAFQLRGAATIVGTLHYVQDQATAEIVAIFYAAVSSGMSPAQALRHAQLTWINRDRARRLAEKAHWAYLLCYGLPG